MSRRGKKKRSPFDGQSQITEKYLESFSGARSGETYQASEQGKKDGVMAGTADSLGDSTPARTVTSKGWEMPSGLVRFLKNLGYGAAILSIIVILVAICVFFINMNLSVQEANKKIITVDSKVGDIEEQVDTLSDDIKENDNKMKLSIVQLMNKIDRILDNISFNRRQPDDRKVNPEENKP